MIYVAFGILSLFVVILYAWVWQLSTCHNQLSRIVNKDEAPTSTRKDEESPSPVESKPTFISEKWSCELKPRKIRSCRGRKQRKHPARKTRKERVKWDR